MFKEKRKTRVRERGMREVTYWRRTRTSNNLPLVLHFFWLLPHPAPARKHPVLFLGDFSLSPLRLLLFFESVAWFGRPKWTRETQLLSLPLSRVFPFLFPPLPPAHGRDFSTASICAGYAPAHPHARLGGASARFCHVAGINSSLFFSFSFLILFFSIVILE